MQRSCGWNEVRCRKGSWFSCREASKGLSGQKCLGPDLLMTSAWLMANTPETGDISLDQCAVRSLTRRAHPDLHNS